MSDAQNSDAQSMLMLSGGLALLVMGTGMILSHPAVRQKLLSTLGAAMPEGDGSLPSSLNVVLPDIERYLKLRSM